MKKWRDRFRAWRGQFHARSVEVDGIRLHIPPGVLDPVLFRSGFVFADFLQTHCTSNESVLDLGCGSGIVGVLTQRAGARVTATDVNPGACEAARINGLKDVRQGDLFQALNDEQFDHVAFNPPYLKGEPESHPLGRALYGGPDLEVIRLFLEAFPQFVSPGGQAWMILSNMEPDAQALLGPEWGLAQETVVNDEILRIFRWSSNSQRDKISVGPAELSSSDTSAT